MKAQEKHKLKNKEISVKICERTKITEKEFATFLLTFKIRIDSAKMTKLLTGIYIHEDIVIRGAYDDYMFDYKNSGKLEDLNSQEKVLWFNRCIIRAEQQNKGLRADVDTGELETTNSYNVVSDTCSEEELDYEIQRLADEID